MGMTNKPDGKMRKIKFVFLSVTTAVIAIAKRTIWAMVLRFFTELPSHTKTFSKSACLKRELYLSAFVLRA